ncbi:hypothetical protein ACFL5M_06470 [Candidatus Neomarinimicrobiota bacterium]
MSRRADSSSRRLGGDRRMIDIPIAFERRIEIDRRSGLDRRDGLDRRWTGAEKLSI